MAVYPWQPAPDQRAVFVAALPRSDLPSVRGMAPAAWDGRTATTVVRGEQVVFDLSVAAPRRTRTPPWDLLPADQWADARRPSPLDRLSRRQTIALIMALVPLWVGALYYKALNITDGDRDEAMRVTAFGVAVYAVIFVVALLSAWIDRRSPDADQAP